MYHSIAGAVFHNQLVKQLHISAPDLPSEILQEVLSSIKAIFVLPSNEKEQVITAYAAAVDHVFLIGIPSAALASVAALLITRRKIVTQKISADSEQPSELGGSVSG